VVAGDDRIGPEEAANACANEALFLPCLLTCQAAPVSADIPQLTDRLGMDQTGPAHAASTTLARQQR
jgi:hypothetical protein